MILRRIRVHVEAENWFAVFLDFAIVVIGVFIGIQVANWNTARADDVRGERLKARLLVEFREIESEHLRHLRDTMHWRDASIAFAQDVLAGRVTSDDPDLGSRIEDISGFRSGHGPATTVQEIVSQGDMDLLHPPALREALIAYNVAAERQRQAFSGAWSPPAYDSPLLRLEQLAAVPASDRPEAYQSTMDAMLRSPDLYVQTGARQIVHESSLVWHEYSRVKACDVLELLGDTCQPSPYVETTP
ncbi:hypothetical protein ACFFUB_09345 [Algimonas porphyrae]|uniref:Secreted protein n=1 Tax=Algimonas porphyrae TaxID=1128113 RepID=A0ABQ5V513_9PROT|nr:hypothetical protein [Algimonas porphyrae]GLQ21681.1 hypothetical protein GCM10007854_26360 [Algimonas porphyrae]